MRVEDFLRVDFNIVTEVIHDKKERKVVAINSSEYLIAFDDGYSQCFTWVRCENCEIVKGLRDE